MLFTLGNNLLETRKELLSYMHAFKERKYIDTSALNVSKMHFLTGNNLTALTLELNCAKNDNRIRAVFFRYL
jgi:hypothetical protein